jgi:hypothetical protein
VSISDERKRQIRAEEEARAKQDAEERYRAEVRRELRGGNVQPAAAAKPPRAPRRSRPPQSGVRTLLLTLGALLVVVGIVLVVIASRGGDDASASEGPEITAGGKGELEPASPPWDPTQLSYDDLFIDAGGNLVAKPARGMMTLADLVRQAKEAETGGSGGGLDTLPPTTPGDLAALIEYVPPEAFAVVAADLEQARRSPAAMDALGFLGEETGAGKVLGDATVAAGMSLLSDARALVIAGIPRGPGEEPQPLLIVRGVFDPTRLEGALTAAGASVVARDSGGVRFQLGGEAVLMREDLLIATPATVLDRALAAAAGDSAGDTGSLRDAVREVWAAPSGFVALWFPDELRTELRGMLPDLAEARWLAAGFDTGAGVTLTGALAFADDATAARAAGALDLAKRFGATQLGDATATAALDQLVLQASGDRVRLSATIDEAHATALVRALLR